MECFGFLTKISIHMCAECERSITGVDQLATDASAAKSGSHSMNEGTVKAQFVVMARRTGSFNGIEHVFKEDYH